MKAYWDTKDNSYIIENENGKRMRVTSGMVDGNLDSPYITMEDTVLVHEVDPLDIVNVGDQVNPAEVEREGVVLRLIGTNCFIVFCENRWRLANGNRLNFIVNEAVLHSKRDDVFLKVVRNRMNEF